MSDGAPQIWDIPLTPAQRWALLQLAFHKEAPQVTDGPAGKKLRRALRAFGLMEIREVIRVHEKVRAATSTSPAPALHKITAENLECVLGWAKVPRTTAIELDVGEVFDMLEDIKAHPAEFAPPAAPAFDAAAEDWTPPADAAPAPSSVTCPSCRQTFELSESLPSPVAS